jgi:hypothetical protein
VEKDKRQLDDLVKLISQFDPQDLQKVIAKMDSKQKQELLDMAINMLQQNMGGEEQQILNTLLQSLLKKKTNFRGLLISPCFFIEWLFLNNKLTF